MSIAAQIGDTVAYREGAGRVREFVQTVAFSMLGGSGGRAVQLAQQARAPARVIAALEETIVPRAAVDPLSIGSLGTVLSPFQILTNAFLSSLSNSAFDAMLPSMKQVPLRTRVISATSMISGASLAELDIKPISSLVSRPAIWKFQRPAPRLSSRGRWCAPARMARRSGSKMN